MFELKDNIQFIGGVGPKKSELLKKELGINNIEDLLYYFPYKHIDRTRFYKISEITSESFHVQVRGTLLRMENVGRRPKTRLVARFTDGKDTIDLIWFKGAKWIESGLKTGTEYIIFGKPNEFNGKFSFIHPEIEESAKVEAGINPALQAFYSSTEKMRDNFITSKTIQKIMHSIFQNLQNIPETLPGYLIEKLRLLSLKDSLLNIHFPKNPDLLKKAETRLKFEELFYIQLSLLKHKNIRKQANNGFIFSKIGKYFNDFYNINLPFELTGAQKRVIKEIRKDICSGKQMNRLLQGDVGSGKTLVALMCMFIALDNGFQTCLMAPTEILSQQHFKTFTRLLAGLGISVELITGSTKKAKRKLLLDDLASGSLQILIGTHALIEDVVQFKNLGLVIIDEQHRFGVAQRAKLWQKNINPPHILVMTATPIPRTLAMTLYGDLDISVIDELPPGRKPIKTIHYYDNKRLDLYEFLKKQIRKGRQIYFVYPLIKESETMDYMYLEEGVEGISHAFPPPKYAISVVHGKMKSKEKEEEMEFFIKNQTQIMIATTVIEVGVDIPNASVMVIESAERFGLSQMHQLRGRVGRGSEESFCILMTSYKLSKEAKIRLETMVNTNDGFEIAEVDMRLRGPGDIEGTQQSGIPFDLKIADLGKDGKILQYARDKALEILDSDPFLQNSENQILNYRLKALSNNNYNWGKIS